MIDIAEETLGFRRTRISLVLRLLAPTFSPPDAPASLTAHLRCDGSAPLPLTGPKTDESTTSVLCLSPGTFSAHDASPEGFE